MINIKNKKLLLIICSILIVSTGVIGVTLSAFTSSDKVVNKFEVADVNIENSEDFNPEPDPENNGNIKKVVSIKNITTKTPAIVRVNITPRWVDEDGNPWSGDASSNVVELTFDEENIIPYTNNLDGNTFNPNKWMDGNDGYYYYTSILPAQDNPSTEDVKENETSTILKSVNIDLEKVENSEEYYGKILIVDVNSEAVQPTEEAYIDAWDKKTHPQIKNILQRHIKNMLNKLLGVGNI